MALILALGVLYGMPGAFTGDSRPHSSTGSGVASGLFSPVKTGEPVELEVMDVIPIEEADTHAVLLISKDQAYLLPLFVTEEAAVSIAFRLAERNSPHPLSADLMDSMVSQLGGKVTQVDIDDVQDDVYTSHITIEQDGKSMNIVARPSDAIAMALTGKAKIMVAPKVLAEAGISREELESLQGGMDEGFGVGGSGEEGGPLPEGHPELYVPTPEDDASNIRL